MQSVFQILNIPDAAVTVFFVTAIALIVACFLPGQEIGPLKVPNISKGKRLAALVAGVIVLAGSVGASLPLLEGASRVAAQAAPHAPALRINARYQVWNETTRQFRLSPGETEVLQAMKIYKTLPGGPKTSCAGPGAVPYSWRVRDPYPRGGEVQITTKLRGGKIQEVGLGAFGTLVMNYCDIHTIKNIDTVPILVEIRYASAAR